MTEEEERLRRKLKEQQEAFRADFFLLFLCVGLFLLFMVVDLTSWTGFFGGWIVVGVAWLLAKKNTSDDE
jgi:hypothetical protein